MNNSKIIDKIKKVAAMQSSPYIAESKQATMMLKELLEKYNISAYEAGVTVNNINNDSNTNNTTKSSDVDVISIDNFSATWTYYIIIAIAIAYQILC